LQVAPDLDVLVQQPAVVGAVGEPAAVPRTVDAEPQPDRIDFLTHQAASPSSRTTIVISLNGFSMRDARPLARAAKRFITRFLPTKASATTSASMSRLWLFSALEIAEFSALRTSLAIRRWLNSSSFSAFWTFRPRIEAATRFSLRALVRSVRTLHIASAGFRRRALDCFPIAYFLLAFLSAAWPGKYRVGANSPNFMPTMSSLTSTGTCFWPLWTPKVRPTNWGMMVERRDQVLITSLRPEFCSASAFFRRYPSTNGPFQTERVIA